MARTRGGVAKSRTRGRVPLVILGLIGVLLALEVAARIVGGAGFEPRNFVADKLSLLSSGAPAEYDPQLGYAPRPGYSGSDNPWNLPVTIDAGGLRRNGPDSGTDGQVSVLAVGGSVVFGEEVGDGETWPAQLEALLGQPVANGGVFGFGLGQSVLRAERLVPGLRPWAVVVSVSDGAIQGTGLIQRAGVEKPYFELSERGLDLRNVPPSLGQPRIAQMGVVRAVLGYSYLIDRAMVRAGRAAWWYAPGFPQVQVQPDAEKVACALMERLKRLEEQAGARVLVVGQYLLQDLSGSGEAGEAGAGARVARVLTCASTAGLATLDTMAPLLARYAEGGDAFLGEFYGQAHLSGRGNRFVAERIADALAELLGGG